MTKRELKTVRDTFNNVSKNFTWCDNYATEELKTLFKILDSFGLSWSCTEDKYHWIDGKPTTKSQVYRIEKDEETLETVLVINRYYGADFLDNGHCELNCYLA